MSTIGLMLLVILFGGFVAFVALAKEETTKMALISMWAFLFVGVLTSIVRALLR